MMAKHDVEQKNGGLFAFFEEFDLARSTFMWYVQQYYHFSDRE
jgi:hypothetical protein